MIKALRNFFKKIFYIGSKDSPGNGLVPLGAFYHKDSIWLLSHDEEGDFYWLEGEDQNGFDESDPKEIKIVLPNGKNEDARLCSDFRISKHGKRMVMTYKRKEGQTSKTVQAFYKSWITWSVLKTGEPPLHRGALVSDFTHKKKYIAYGSDGLDMYMYTSKDLSHWSEGEKLPVCCREDHFDHAPLNILEAKKVEEGILVVYDTSVKIFGTRTLQIGAVIFSEDDPSHVKWRSEVSLWEEVIPNDKDTFRAMDMVLIGDQMILYYVNKNNLLFSIVLPHPILGFRISPDHPQLSKVLNNPLFHPDDHPDWGKIGVFNPAAVKTGDGKVHLVYRAIGLDGVSRFGYAQSEDGEDFNERLEDPVFHMKRPRHESNRKMEFDPEMYASGGSWGGCEDPRMVNIDGRIYLTFNAFDGWDFIRMAFSSINEKDFLKKRWKWTYPKLISEPGEINKNWVLFPEKINGKFAILHSITPDIQIDFVDSLDDLASGKKKIKSKFKQKKGRVGWNTWFRGVGPPPLKTSEGWLVFYHANSNGDSRYKLGAMLLDLENPKKVLGHSSSPILLPNEWYENDSKPGVVYACGAVIKDDHLMVYYGGGDKHICAAKAPLDEFLGKLKENLLLV